MILTSFKATKVFDYLDFDIHFNKDISFLVGGNGSGKTTALKLISALATPNLRDLLQIPFESISLRIEHEKKLVELSAVTSKDKVVLSMSGCNSELALPSSSNLKFDFGSADKLDEYFDVLTRKFAESELIKQISQLPTPVFLGLDRRHDTMMSQGEYYQEREYRLRHNGRMAPGRKFFRGSLGVSLMETELLVQNAYKRLREIEERQSTKLRDSILLSTFSYTTYNQESPSSLGGWHEREVVKERQKEIKDALSKIGVRDSRLNSELDEFFGRVTQLFADLKVEGRGNGIEWLLNKAQIDRMARIVEIIDEHRTKTASILKPINQFLGVINDFFRDSNKALELDAVGQLVVNFPNGVKATIEGLSSGERQILVIFAHAFFNENNRRGSVFIIDEPELSLHLMWQEKFAAAILETGPGSQFILATHSPEIIGANKSKAVQCR